MKEKLKIVKSEECGKVKIEAYYDDIHLLTLTYNKHLDMFLLTVEHATIASRRTLQALIEALEKVKEVIERSASF